jgi:hypothetical protein
MAKRQDIIMHKLIFILIIVSLSACVNPGIDTEYSEYPGPSLQIRKELYLDNHEKSMELNCWIQLSSLPKQYCLA